MLRDYRLPMPGTFTIGRFYVFVVVVALMFVVPASGAQRVLNVGTSRSLDPPLRQRAALVAFSGASDSDRSPLPAPLARSPNLDSDQSSAEATGSSASRPTGQDNAAAIPQLNATSAPAAPAIQVYLDPGHGGIDEGTSGTTDSGTPVKEKDITLALALRTAARLRADGIGVTLSRNDDSTPGATSSDYTRDGKIFTYLGVLADLQRRIDRANGSGARVFLSLHLNAFSDPSVRGTQTFYDGARPYANQSLSLATLVQASVIEAFRSQGYSTPDRGATDDQRLQGDSMGILPANYNHLILLGPAIPGVLRPTMMPAALCEFVFLSNPTEATAIAQPVIQELIASAVTNAVEQYLRANPAAPAAGT